MSQRASTLYPRAFSELEIRGLRLKNRLCFAPMGLDLAHRDGRFSEELADFYDGIVAGGCGFIVLSNASVSPDSILQPNGLRLHEESQADSLRDFVQQTRSRGVEVGIQLQHYGGQGVTTYSRGMPLLTPSGIGSTALKRKDMRYRVRAMTLQDIEAVKSQFIHSALLAQSAGARLIQLQASNGYLIGSFQSPATNQRTDAYGGDAVGRAALLLEIVAGIRAAVGHEMVIGVRLGVDDCLEEGGTVPSDFEEVIPRLEDAGADLFELSVCVADNFAKLTDDSQGMAARMRMHAAQIKRYARAPVGFAGLVKSVGDAESILAAGEADFVGMARALFADNDLIRKTLEGRTEDIHWCLWDGKCFKDKHNPKYQRVYCCVNPRYLRPA